MDCYLSHILHLCARTSRTCHRAQQRRMRAPRACFRMLRRRLRAPRACFRMLRRRLRAPRACEPGAERSAADSDESTPPRTMPRGRAPPPHPPLPPLAGSGPGRERPGRMGGTRAYPSCATGVPPPPPPPQPPFPGPHHAPGRRLLLRQRPHHHRRARRPPALPPA